MSLIKEFREFAIKGNAVDMAVGIIVGAAFGKTVSSLVNDVIMPPIGLLLGGADFGKLQIVLKQPGLDPAKEPGVALRYGAFINATLDFVIVAFCVFLLVKAINAARRLAEHAPKA